MITGLKGLAADGHEINCRTCRSGKTCNVANAHGYWVGACVRYKPEKPMTNADKYFRNATDEEIAELMTKTGSEFNCFPGATDADCEKAGSWWNGCKKCWLDWLKQEVSE